VKTPLNAHLTALNPVDAAPIIDENNLDQPL
jgi:hypothetical protein